MRPVAVLIDYQDWQKIEQILEAHQLQQKEEFNINNYAGVMVGGSSYDTAKFSLHE